ncbi:hypothetical protein M405DRAFT_807842 [Rhizopogon salebrosus TDB-379]|nr:hypothetical protein M405DRAFT_807842 [Rhizopogon salebrosus TDB-379]
MHAGTNTWHYLVKDGRDGGATTHALCSILVLDSGSLGFVWRYRDLSMYATCLPEWLR